MTIRAQRVVMANQSLLEVSFGSDRVQIDANHPTATSTKRERERKKHMCMDWTARGLCFRVLI